MASLRVVVTLVLALTLCFAASVSAQAVGPICLQAGEGQRRQIFEIFALSMGSTSNRAQFLLSAVSLDLPSAGQPRSRARSPGSPSSRRFPSTSRPELSRG
jgi:uncharacterized membrane protein